MTVPCTESPVQLFQRTETSQVLSMGKHTPSQPPRVRLELQFDYIHMLGDLEEVA